MRKILPFESKTIENEEVWLKKERGLKIIKRAKGLRACIYFKACNASWVLECLRDAKRFPREYHLV